MVEAVRQSLGTLRMVVSCERRHLRRVQVRVGELGTDGRSVVFRLPSQPVPASVAARRKDVRQLANPVGRCC